MFFTSGVPILHLIVTPFPSVWHKAGDNANAIDWDDTEDLNKILRVFVAEYLQVCWIWDHILDGLLLWLVRLNLSFCEWARSVPTSLHVVLAQK